MAAFLAFAAAVVPFLLADPAAEAQSLSVLPVNVLFSPGQRATSLTVTNTGTTETAIQIRAYAWSQKDGDDQLTESDAAVLSPPLARMAPGASQVIRLILRQPPQGREATYRILVDQIPPPAEPGIVHMVLRLSIPIFAKPATRAIPHLQFHMEMNAGKLFLVVINDGLSHEVIHDIVLSTSDGRKLKEESTASPYILAGATRRWPIAAQGPLPLPSETLQLTALSDAGAIEQKVGFVTAP
ncbi:MAG TPA: fimbria/pilus periplasmic chaperone [Acidobacteriaceae bacterium]|jgi:fimbrial chaperone protein|nr:fimbria/pilus periplasmic chaperone [Acidobacteriaceae bacterium]